MDSSIAFSGYENPDAFSLRYKVLERQQNHFDVSSNDINLFNLNRDLRRIKTSKIFLKLSQKFSFEE
jgi:hypothetical protein